MYYKKIIIIIKLSFIIIICTKYLHTAETQNNESISTFQNIQKNINEIFKSINPSNTEIDDGNFNILLQPCMKKFIQDNQQKILQDEDSRQYCAEICAEIELIDELDILLKRETTRIVSTKDGLAGVYYYAYSTNAKESIRYLVDNNITISDTDTNKYFKKLLDQPILPVIEYLIINTPNVLNDLNPVQLKKLCRIKFTDNVYQIIYTKLMHREYIKEIIQNKNTSFICFLAKTLSTNGDFKNIINEIYFSYLFSQKSSESLAFMLREIPELIPNQTAIDDEYKTQAHQENVKNMAILRTNSFSSPPSEAAINEIIIENAILDKHAQIQIEIMKNLEKKKTTSAYFMTQKEQIIAQKEQIKKRMDLIRTYLSLFSSAQQRQEATQTEHANSTGKEMDDKITPLDIKFSFIDFIDFHEIPFLHSLGLTGKDVKVYISEVFGVKDIPSLSCAECLGGDEHNHGVGVAGIIRRIANESTLYGGFNVPAFIPEDTDIVNCSWGIDRDYGQENAYLSHIQKKRHLFIFATDNFPRPMIEQVSMREVLGASYKDQTLLNNIIWVINITQSSLVNTATAYPGAEFKDHSISALGTDINVINNSGIFDTKTGSIQAAPIITAVAALLKEKFPDFSPFDLKTCILESADQHVFSTNPLIEGKHLGDGSILLNPEKYGKGILNARHALLYGEILNTARQRDLINNIPADSTDIKTAYKRMVKIKDNHNANLIKDKLLRKKKIKRS
jgi:hypothetical protein